MTVYEKIDAQCKGKEDSTIWTVGQHLKDILRADPSLEEIVDKDLDVPGMGIADCDKKIFEWGKPKASRSNPGVGISHQQAEKIIREFYGLPLAGAAAPAPAPRFIVGVDLAGEDTLDFADFLGD